MTPIVPHEARGVGCRIVFVLDNAPVEVARAGGTGFGAIVRGVRALSERATAIPPRLGRAFGDDDAP
jgi:hypothetical protein